MEGFEKNIKILLNPTYGVFNIYVKVGKLPSMEKYDWIG